MAENEGLHLQLTADASGYVSTINNAKNKLVDLAAQTKILKQGEKDIQKALTESKKKYGENSTQVDKLTADLADNAREQEKLKQEIKEVNTVLDKASKEYAEYGNSAKQSFDSVSQQSQKTVDTLKSGFNAVKAMILGYAGKKLYEVLIGTNAEYEQSMTSFEVLLQSADKADAMMRKLEKMGASTPFELSDLTGATEQLLAFGVAEQDIEAKLQQLGDLSMGNADKFERLTSAYGKMLAKGKVSLEELNLFTEAGVPILEELQNQYDATGEEMFKMISDGIVGVEEINSAIESMTGQGGQFYGMMEKQSQTFEGMMSTMSDNVTMFGRLVGEETFGILKTELEGILNTINQMSESGELQAIAHDLGQDIATAVTFIIDLVKWLYEMKDVLIAGSAAVITYKTSFAILTSAVSAFNAIKELFNIITGKTVLCKNLETGETIKLTAAEYAEAKAKKVAIMEQNAFNVACDSNIYLALAAAILAIVSAIVSYNIVTGEAIDKSNELRDSYKDAKQQMEDSIATKEAEKQATISLLNRLLELDKIIEDEAISQEEANNAHEEFDVIADELKQKIPTITDYLYDETGAIDVQTDAVLKLTNAYLDLMMAQAKADAYKGLYTEAYKNVAVAKKEVKSWEDSIKVTENDLANGGSTSGFAGWLVDAFYGQSALEDDLAWKNSNLTAAKNDVDYYEDEAQYYEELFLAEQKKIKELTPNVKPSSSGGGKSSSGGGKSSSGGGKSSSGGGKSSTSNTKTQAEIDLENFKKEYEDFIDYIDERNFYDDWKKHIGSAYGDSELEVYNNLLGKLKTARKEGIIDAEYFAEKSKEINRKIYTAEQNLTKEQKKEYEKRRNISNEYIRQREFYDDWGEDSKVDAIQRVMNYTDEAYKNGVLSWEEYCEEISGLSEDLYSEVRDIVENETELVKEQLENELETKKQYIEAELEYIKQKYDKEIEYLDELKAKREAEKEDQNYAERMARLQAKLEYEMDDDNRRALKKEIAELQDEIDDTEFDREIERKKSVLENKKVSADKKAQKQLDKLSADYEKVMSDTNIAKIVYENLDFEKFNEMGVLLGENLIAGMSGALGPFINAINKLVTLGGNIQSPANNTVTTTDNSISLNQNINGASEIPTLGALKKFVDDMLFLKGRLG